MERSGSLGLLDQVFGYLFPTEKPSSPTLQRNDIDDHQEEHISTIDRELRDIKTGGKAPQGTVKNNIHEFYNNNYEFREIMSMNVQMKARPLIAILFICIFLLVLFRFSKRSENSKLKIPKAMSIFWFFATIQLYLELNWLSLEAQPKSYSKVLFLGLVPLEQASNYIPEILNLLLFLICLFYFFSLIFRFNEIFGQDDMQEM